jgi:uncharacterized protein (DUF58 family)
VQAVSIHDPAEYQLPTPGLASLCWTTPHGELSQALDAALRQRIQQEAATRRDALAGSLRQAGIALHELSTRDDDLLTAVRGLC